MSEHKEILDHAFSGAGYVGIGCEHCGEQRQQHLRPVVLAADVAALTARAERAEAREVALREALLYYICRDHVGAGVDVWCIDADCNRMRVSLADTEAAGNAVLAERAALRRVADVARDWRDAGNKPGWDPVFPAAKALRDALAALDEGRAR